MVARYSARLDMNTGSYEVIDKEGYLVVASGIPNLRKANQVTLTLNAQIAQHGRPAGEVTK